MNTLADQYYIKALDQYPYSLEEAIESLSYSLSYNEEHVGANYLMGKIYKEQMNNFLKAEEYYIRALASNPEDMNTCMDYIYVLIVLKEYDKALKLINYTIKLKGVDLSKTYSLMALVFEYKREYDKALNLYKEAKFEAYNEDSINFLTNEIKRIKKKKKMVKKLEANQTENQEAL